MSGWPRILNADGFFLRDDLASKADRIAVRLDDRVVTYAEVDRMASGYAALLLDLGVRKGDRVLVLLDDGIDYPAAIFGIMRVGAVVVMMNPGLTPQNLAGITRLAEPGAVVVAGRYEEAYRSAVGEGCPPLLV
ncbi:MAG: AMP-binding protein, partial [Actinomycetes bacterium]